MNSLYPFLIFLIAIYAIQNCVNAKMKKLAKDELQIDGGQNWQGINSTSIQNSFITGISLTPPIPALMNVRGNAQEVPIPDSNVQIETKLAKVEILKPKKKQNEQNERRTKREEEEEKAELEEEPLNDLGDGLEKIVDEVVETEIGPEEEEKSPKKAKKKFSKQAVKKEANTKEKSGGGTAAATTPPTADKKTAIGPAQKSKIEGKTDEKDKEKGGQMAGTDAGGTKPTSQPTATTDSKSTAVGGKDKAPPATASQMPQGPPMPPPGSIPAPQTPQVQPPSSGPNSSSGQQNLRKMKPILWNGIFGECLAH